MLCIYDCSYTIVCKSEECEWLMKTFAINKSDMFQIRTFNMDHISPLKDRVCVTTQPTGRD